MKNLFVVHTQYSLILASGLTKGRFASGNNDLILFQDFKLNKELSDKLLSIFNNTLLLQGTFSLANGSSLAKAKHYYNSIKSSKSFIKNKYDKVFIVLDMNLPEMHIMKRAYAMNHEAEFIALEDGSYPYFLNHVTAGGLDKNSFTRFVREILFKYFLGCGKFYSFEGRFMGANMWLKSIYLTYKDHARMIYKNKNRIEITTEEFNAGIDLLFNGTNTNFRKNAVIIILDKLDVYKNLGSIKRLIAELILLCENNKNTIYYKYHPRENQNLDELKNCIELDRNVAIEIYYKDCLPAKPLVIGIKSTGLQTAKKMGFEVVSLAKAADEHNEDVISFYKKIGISVPDNISQIRQLLS